MSFKAEFQPIRFTETALEHARLLGIPIEWIIAEAVTRIEHVSSPNPPHKGYLQGVTKEFMEAFHKEGRVVLREKDKRSEFPPHLINNYYRLRLEGNPFDLAASSI